MRLIGTAGHIDHGKSTLVQALSGIHPSRLPEERARGMTIDLGYAYLTHPDGYRLGIVDVPGHEKLVRNMVAGATGFELALWVVDARESVMPQSREHLQILDLLAVRALVPVVTKADLATGDEVARTQREMDEVLRRVRVPVRPAHTVDSVSGRGIAELREAVFAACRGAAESDEDASPYLPIDRAFSVRGIGTVMTGTLVRGRLSKGDRVMISSQPGEWRIRSLHNHHEQVGEVGPGHRVGVNLAGLDAGAVRRGDLLLSPGDPHAARFLNVRLQPVDGVSPEWRHGLRMLFYAGCTETECRLWDLARDAGGWWGQLELREPLHFFPGQRFVLRTTSPLTTVAGGEVLDLAPDRPRRVTPAERAAYALRVRGEAYLESYAARARAPLHDLGALARRWMVPEAALLRQAADGPSLRTGATGERASTRNFVWRGEFEVDLVQRLRGFVDRQPREEQHVPYAQLARELRVRDADLEGLLSCVLRLGGPEWAWFRAVGRQERTGWVLHARSATLSAGEQRIADRILAQLRAEGLRPSRIHEYRSAHPLAERVVAWLREQQRVVRISEDFMLHAELAEELRQAPARRGLDGFRASEFGAALGLSRKYSIPYLEFLQREGVLRRVGELHHRA